MAGTQESLSLNKLRRGIFTGASRSPCGLVTVASSTSSAVPWDFVGLWHVAVVHRFHVGPTRLEVMSTFLLPGELARPLFRVLHARRSRFRAGITVSHAD